eukprot:2870718-Rhodomonas_salina.1
MRRASASRSRSIRESSLKASATDKIRTARGGDGAIIFIFSSGWIECFPSLRAGAADSCRHVSTVARMLLPALSRLPTSEVSTKAPMLLLALRGLPTSRGSGAAA